METKTTESVTAPSMTLVQALWHVADQQTRAALRFLEKRVSDDDLRRLQRVRISGAPYDPAMRPSVTLNEDEEWRLRYAETYTRILRSLSQCLETGALHLTGVQMWPERRTEREPIPGVWAADMVFDVERGSVSVGAMVYVALQLSTECPSLITRTDAPSLVRGHRLPDPITPGNIRALSDQEVLLLLEDHARRVVEGPDAKLIPPGKISLLPVIKRKLLHRVERGEQRPTWGAEAHALAEWIASKLLSHDTTKASTIEKKLSRFYVRPKG
ncbi:hypothetical protein [Falsiroseomonas sp.]|uniref:hypothetical protein n=1 Tax=Falsiroseomonas sp. TaxID=2870721 RepID=UPI0035675CEB